METPLRPTDLTFSINCQGGRWSRHTRLTQLYRLLIATHNKPPVWPTSASLFTKHKHVIISLNFDGQQAVASTQLWLHKLSTIILFNRINRIVHLTFVTTFSFGCLSFFIVFFLPQAAAAAVFLYSSDPNDRRLAAYSRAPMHSTRQPREMGDEICCRRWIYIAIKAHLINDALLIRWFVCNGSDIVVTPCGIFVTSPAVQGPMMSLFMRRLIVFITFSAKICRSADVNRQQLSLAYVNGLLQRRIARCQISNAQCLARSTPGRRTHVNYLRHGNCCWETTPGTSDVITILWNANHPR
jgi:hypothetical protein